MILPYDEDLGGIMLSNKRRGFTLIELLVVVLIIGILAAVALPQYTKAVEKSRITQALTFLNAVYKSYQLCVLANGEPGESTTHPCAAENGNLFSHMDIELPGELQTGDDCEDMFCIKTKDWEYNDGNGIFYAERIANGDNPYYLQMMLTTYEETIDCWNNEPLGAANCTTICGSDGCRIAGDPE